MYLRKLISTLITGGIIMASTTSASTLTIHIKDVSEKGGKIMLAVFDKEEIWLNEPTKGLRENAITPETTVVINDLPAGEYAISVYQDENENKSLDTGFLGIPKEPYGFSNDAPVRFGPPAWDKAVFTVTEGDNEVTIHL